MHRPARRSREGGVRERQPRTLLLLYLPQHRRRANTPSQKLFQMHKDIVLPPLPAGIENLGENSVCALQGMIDDEKKRFISVQAHPEFTREIVTEMLTVRKGLGIFTEEEYEDMMSRVGDDHDGVEVMRAMLKFVRGEDV